MTTGTKIGIWIAALGAVATAAALGFLILLFFATLTAIGNVGSGSGSAQFGREVVCTPYVNDVLARHKDGYTDNQIAKAVTYAAQDKQDLANKVTPSVFVACGTPTQVLTASGVAAK